jgi:hypothetical protein
MSSMKIKVSYTLLNKCTSLGLILTRVFTTPIMFEMKGCASLMLCKIRVSLLKRCIQFFSIITSFFIILMAQYSLLPYLARITYINTSVDYAEGNGITFPFSHILMRNINFVFHLAMSISLSYKENVLVIYKTALQNITCYFLCDYCAVSSWYMLMHLQRLVVLSVCTMH